MVVEFYNDLLNNVESVGMSLCALCKQLDYCALL